MLPLMSDLTGANAVGPRTSVRHEKGRFEFNVIETLGKADLSY